MKVFALLLVFVGAFLAGEAYEKSCDLPADRGMCLAYMPKYYYDVETGTCKKFIYGGCQGNGNRYDTEEECLANCANRGRRPATDEDVCSLEPETGLCDAYFPSYYFDVKSGQCKKFVYGGCGGNGNRFRTEKECYDSCSEQKMSELDICTLEADKGPCLVFVPKYYYNSKTGKCERFIYGGCRGNDNRFCTEKECNEACGQRAEEEDVDVCTLEADGGPCRASFEMFYFDSKTGECKEFIYGGCLGNGNRFGSKKECYQKCAAVWEAQEGCSEDPETGLCKGYFPRYYFNKDKGVCEEFIYGGCGGNKNNYKSYKECADACGAP